MSDRLRPIPKSIAEAARFTFRHRRAVGAVALSTTLSFAAPLPEAPKPLTHVKVGSYNSAIMDQLVENEGATLRGGPSTVSAPIGKAPIGERFEVSGYAENGSWVRVKLNADDPDIRINDGMVRLDKNGQPQIPTDVYINRSLVVRAPEPKKK